MELLEGPDLEFLEQACQLGENANVIASGGISNIKDVTRC